MKDTRFWKSNSYRFYLGGGLEYFIIAEIFYRPIEFSIIEPKEI